MPQPTLTTERLVLRLFDLADAPAVRRLAGAREVAGTTLNALRPDGAGDGGPDPGPRAHARGSITALLRSAPDGDAAPKPNGPAGHSISEVD